MADETAWLIEFTPFPEPLYLSVDGNFDRDSLKAVRFSRKQDGEAMLAYMHKFRTDHGYGTDPRYTRILHGEDCYRVAEHMWCAPTVECSGSAK
jgi:hypothetical protein